MVKMLLPLRRVVPSLDIHAEKGHYVNQIFGHLKSQTLAGFHLSLKYSSTGVVFVCVITTTINKNNDNADL